MAEMERVYPPIAVKAEAAAKMLGVSKPTLYEIARREDFRASFRVGGCLLFSVDGLKEWVRKQTEVSESA